MQENIELNLCSEILAEMDKMGFSDEHKNYVINNSRFREAVAGTCAFQKTILTTMFFKILMNGSTLVPSQIRLAVNIAPTAEGWLDDIKLVVLPFLKANEDKFFINNF